MSTQPLTHPRIGAIAMSFHEEEDVAHELEFSDKSRADGCGSTRAAIR
jgi:hypothetical protein